MRESQRKEVSISWLISHRALATLEDPGDEETGTQLYQGDAST